MTEQEFRKYFNKTMARIMNLLEISNSNDHLKREIKKELFDFSDGLKEAGAIKEGKKYHENSTMEK